MQGEALDLFAPANTTSATSTVREEPVAGAEAETCGTCGAGNTKPNGFVVCTMLGKGWEWFAPSATCSFRPSQWMPITAATRARREAQNGIDQAVTAADNAIEGWSETAYAFIRLFCAQNKGKQCIGGEIVAASIEKGVIQPPNLKAWGAPLQRAAREGLLKKIGHAPDPNRHNNPVPLWEVQ